MVGYSAERACDGEVTHVPESGGRPRLHASLAHMPLKEALQIAFSHPSFREGLQRAHDADIDPEVLGGVCTAL